MTRKDKIIDILVCALWALSLALFAYLPILYIIFYIMEKKV